MAPAGAVAAAWGSSGGSSGAAPSLSQQEQQEDDGADADADMERRGSHSQASGRRSAAESGSGRGGGSGESPLSSPSSQPCTYSYSRLQLATPRDLAAAAWALDFFKFNDPQFWAAAAEAALAELPSLAPAALANILTGAAHSTVAAASAALSRRSKPAVVRCW